MKYICQRLEVKTPEEFLKAVENGYVISYIKYPKEKQKEFALYFSNNMQKRGDACAYCAVYMDLKTEDFGRKFLVMNLLEQLAKKGYTPAAYTYACRYKEAHKSPEDQKFAMDILKILAKRGYPLAMNSLGFHLMEVEKKEKEGFKYMKQAALSGMMFPCIRVALCYRDGRAGLRKNYTDYLKWLLLAKKCSPMDDLDAEVLQRHFDGLPNICQHCLERDAKVLAPNGKYYVCKNCGKKFK